MGAIRFLFLMLTGSKTQLPVQSEPGVVSCTGDRGIEFADKIELFSLQRENTRTKA